MQSSEKVRKGALRFYSRHPVEFICAWLDTYDPRKAASGKQAWMPFVLFKRQAEFVQFLLACLDGEASGLAEKSRDIGATWVCVGFSIWLWRFRPGASIGWGSRDRDLVDRLGDMDSIFEKIRSAIRRLNPIFWPKDFLPDEHMYYQRILNPENGNQITGEIGDDIGRGGRKLIYFKDESAHYKRPELIEAALMDNTRVQIDISSVNGIGNVFWRKRDQGVDWFPGKPVVKDRTNVFVFDWSDHPEKTQAWYAERRAKAEAEGLLHKFKQEVDRDYSGAVVGTIIPSEWVKAAIDAHKKLGWKEGEGERGPLVSALDVADGGGDTNAQAARKGVTLKFLDEWGALDTAETTRRAIKNLERLKEPRISFWYDAVGVGSGVKAESNRLRQEKLLPKGLSIQPWFASASPLKPDDHVIPHDRQSPLNKDFYANLKAQGWWQLRLRFERTWRAVEKGETFKPDELICLDSAAIGNLLPRLCKELSQPTASPTALLKLVVDKTPEGTKSPNLADAVMMAFWPAASSYDFTMSWVR
jgi:hypothetical protein